MPVSAIIPGQKWKRSGPACFFATFNPANRSTLIEIGYTDHTIVRKAPMLGADPSLWYEIDLSTGQPVIDQSTGLPVQSRTEFEAFLLTIYMAGLHLASMSSQDYDLDADIVAGGIADQYSKLKTLDFLVLTGAKAYPDLIKHLKTPLNPNPPARPNLWDVPDGNRQSMVITIEKIGLKGYIQYLYADRGITFEEYLSFVRYFYPVGPARQAYLSTVIPFFRSRLIEWFSDEQLDQLES